MPLLGAWLAAHRVRRARRERFQVYSRTNASLDKMCHTICGHRRSRRDGNAWPHSSPHPTLVAFGAASSCSTGFGYAPAPQRRLRKRLELHGARVSLVDEYRTSQCCSRCNEQLSDVVRVLHPKRTTCDEPPRRGVVHAIKRCTRCAVRARDGVSHPRHVHRDTNAACNIARVYMTLALSKERPTAFARRFV